jgi:hypothetical protein
MYMADLASVRLLCVCRACKRDGLAWLLSVTFGHFYITVFGISPAERMARAETRVWRTREEFNLPRERTPARVLG